jgi:hypothetical protein
MALRASIVICTDGRGKAVANTLKCLEKLEGDPFEVCVVQGPTHDETAEVLRQWSGRIKIAKSGERNISISRNIGIGLAAGDIVAFLDDDAFPEPSWLQRLIAAFDAPNVAGAGGLVLDHTGLTPQYLHSSIDRFGRADTFNRKPLDRYNFPFSYNVPYMQGTNCAFRRTALISVGGFDEEYEYFLDEADLCCRLNDSGWKLRQRDDAVVHHKFLPSLIRDTARITHSRYTMLKNKLYFSLQNGRRHFSEPAAIADMKLFVRQNEAALRMHVRRHGLPSSVLDRFSNDAASAQRIGLARGRDFRRLLSQDAADRSAPAFLEFPRSVQPCPEIHLYVSFADSWHRRDAHDLSERGHHVCVASLSEDEDRIDFEDGIWIYRFSPSGRFSLFNSPRFMAIERAIRHVKQRGPIASLHAPVDDGEAQSFLSMRHASPI